MKRLALFFIALLSILGCSKEERAIVGSKWVFQFDGSPYVMEFTSKSDVRLYEVDANYNYKDGLLEGTYSYNNGKIVFGEQFGLVKASIIILYYRYYFMDAVIDGDILKVNASEEKIVIPIVDGKAQEPEITYLGEKTFSLMKLAL